MNNKEKKCHVKIGYVALHYFKLGIDLIHHFTSSCHRYVIITHKECKSLIINYYWTLHTLTHIRGWCYVGLSIIEFEVNFRVHRNRWRETLIRVGNSLYLHKCWQSWQSVSCNVQERCMVKCVTKIG